MAGVATLLAPERERLLAASTRHPREHHRCRECRAHRVWHTCSEHHCRPHNDRADRNARRQADDDGTSSDQELPGEQGPE